MPTTSSTTGKVKGGVIYDKATDHQNRHLRVDCRLDGSRSSFRLEFVQRHPDGKHAEPVFPARRHHLHDCHEDHRNVRCVEERHLLATRGDLRVASFVSARLSPARFPFTPSHFHTKLYLLIRFLQIYLHMSFFFCTFAADFLCTHGCTYEYVRIYRGAARQNRMKIVNN